MDETKNFAEKHTKWIKIAKDIEKSNLTLEQVKNLHDNEKSYKKIEDLKSSITIINKQKRLIFVGVILSPLIIGLFIIKYAKEKRNELIKLIESTFYDVQIENETRTKELYDIYYSINTTFLTYRKREYLIDKCDSFLAELQILNKNSTLFNNSCNKAITESICTITELKNKFETYNDEFVEKRISEYDYLFEKSLFPLDQYQKKSRCN